MMSNLNQQNQFINKSITDVCNVVDLLQTQGITVLEIKMGDKRPCVIVLHSRQCKKLRSVTQMRSFNGRVRKLRKVSIMSGCRVQWEQPEEAVACG